MLGWEGISDRFYRPEHVVVAMMSIIVGISFAPCSGRVGGLGYVDIYPSRGSSD